MINVIFMRRHNLWCFFDSYDIQVRKQYQMHYINILLYTSWCCIASLYFSISQKHDFGYLLRPFCFAQEGKEQREVKLYTFDGALKKIILGWIKMQLRKMPSRRYVKSRLMRANGSLMT